MSENLNIDAAMLNQLPPEVKALIINMIKGGQKAAVPQAEPSEMNKKEIPENPGLQDYTELYCDCFKKGKIGCVTRAEQFGDSDMYRILFSVDCGEIRRNEVQYQLEMLAKELGGTALAHKFQKNCTVAKKEAKEREKQQKAKEEQARRIKEQEEKARKDAEGNKTQFSNLPEGCQNMYIGTEWIADDDGVRKFEQSGNTMKRVEACMYPILVTKLYRPLDNADGATRRIELKFGSEEGWQTATVEREVIANANKIITLSNSGAGVTSDNARQCTNFMASMLKESSRRGMLRIVNTLNKLGWDKDFKNFLPYTTEDFVFERQNDMPELMEALKAHGNRTAWYKKFEEILALDYAPFKLATAAVLSSVILPMLPKQDSFVVDLYGGSGYGKTATLSIVTTIFSSMDDGGILIDSDNTQAYLEISADTLNNFPIIMDDMSKGDQEKKRKFQQTVMMLASGRGRNRATKDMKQKKKYKFKLTALVSSEQNVTMGWTTNGSVYRVIPKQVTERLPYLDKKKYPDLENIEDIIAFFQNNYGFCGREFVEKVKELGQEEIIKRNGKNLERARKLARDNGREGRQATSIAVLLTAYEIATEFLFQNGSEFTDEELLDIMVKSDDVDQYMRFYRSIISQCVSSPGKIEGFTDPEDIRGEYWGIYKANDKKNTESGETLSIFPYILEKWAKESDLDLNLFYKEMRDRGLLYSDKDTNQTKTNSLRTGRAERVIKLKMPHYEVEKEQPSERKEKRTTGSAVAELQQIKFQTVEMDDEDIPFD